MTRWIRSAVLALAAATAVTTAFAQAKPAKLKLGMATFLSGPAAVFGVPGKAAAHPPELWRSSIDELTPYALSRRANFPLVPPKHMCRADQPMFVRGVNPC